MMIKKLLEKYKEILMYLIFGVLTTLVSYIVYAIFYYKIGASALVSNIFSWIFSVTFAFITNKLFVFESKSFKLAKFFYEAASFYGCRLLSGVVETLFIWLTVDLLSLNSMFMKILISVFVVIVNYFFSKLFIFKKEKNKH